MVFAGEFNSNDIPFVSHPVWSHIAFVLFIFFITIVLINLLNGLAISDTNKILSKAELIGLISRLRLIAYLEDIACGEPFSRFRNSHSLRWNPFGFFTNRILLFPHLENGKITVMCDNLDDYSNSVNRDEHWPILEMDPVIIKQAKRIIFDKNQRSDISDNENIRIVLNKQQQELIVVENALKNLSCALKNLISSN
ncbi:Uncharacterized protein DBV15_00471 [Temnothorax longispinosus]|uniref:Ion transport domain-containing protein n=1 Tax=Temnothorax longispinosus TaxID=300112 RepID=A0A4S2JQB1_9HYME|nr:Uncharacterized protein DBV15_00471 [Temnothorax longispinosus]